MVMYVFIHVGVRCLIVLWTKIHPFQLKVHSALNPDGVPVSQTTLKDPLPVSNSGLDEDN